MNPYGYCPVCGSEIASRERRPDGNDICDEGHKFPSKDAISDKGECLLPIVRQRLQKLLELVDEEVIVNILAERRENPENWRYVPGFRGRS